MSITLTVAEIKDLAEFAGLVLHGKYAPSDDEMEAEVVVTDALAEGMLDEGTGERVKSRLIAYFADYPEEGGIPLGATP